MSKKLWGGRFKKEMHPVLKCFSYSLETDRELFSAELQVNEAYAKMLAKIGILTGEENKKLLRAISVIRGNSSAEKLKSLTGRYEDVHTFIQMELEKKAGAVAKKIHTGRSRNDLVVTSTRIYLR